MKFDLKKFSINFDKIEENMEILFKKHKHAVVNLITEDKNWYSVSIIGINKEKNKKLRIMSGRDENVTKRMTLDATPGTVQSLLKLQITCDNYRYVGIHPIKERKV